MWSTRRSSTEHETLEEIKRGANKENLWSSFIVHGHFSSYSFQVQVSGKQNWLTEWQNKHRTVEMETYLSYSPLGFVSAQAHTGQSYNTTWKTHTQQVNLSLSLASSIIIIIIINTRILGLHSHSCKSGLSRKAVILPGSLKESHTSCHTSPLSTACAGFRLGYYWSRLEFV